VSSKKAPEKARAGVTALPSGIRQRGCQEGFAAKLNARIPHVVENSGVRSFWVFHSGAAMEYSDAKRSLRVFRFSWRQDEVPACPSDKSVVTCKAMRP